MKISAIITGATGMVGEGVLHECLQHPDVERILIINRKPTGLAHPKLKEIIHENFFDLSAAEDQLNNYNACFFCLGVSSVGLNETKYYELTYSLTLQFAKTVSKRNPDLVFCYISGAGTDSTERGRSMWARVKGKTENALMKLPFKKVYAFRPGYMQPTPGLKHANRWYLLLAWLYPVWRTFFPKYVTTLKELGLAMINCVRLGYEKSIIEVKDIQKLANAN